MKKILLLLLLSTNVNAIENYKLSEAELKLLSSIAKTQPPIVYEPLKEYSIENDIPSKQSMITYKEHCQYGMDILGGCKNKPFKISKKPLPKNINHARVL